MILANRAGIKTLYSALRKWGSKLLFRHLFHGPFRRRFMVLFHIGADNENSYKTPHL